MEYNNIPMADYIEEYIRRKYRGKPKDDVKTIRKLLLETPNSFLPNWEYTGSFEAAARLTILPLTQGKSTAIDKLKTFHEYLSDNKAVHFDVIWPVVDVSSRFERLIAIAKFLQDHFFETEAATIEALEEYLWVGERTLRDDIRAMKQNQAPGSSSLFSSLFQNSVFFEDDRHALKFLSSAHPIFLMENLTGVIYTLEALLEKARDPLFHDWILQTAGHIWDQLTEYAREKVIKRINYDYQGTPDLLDLFHETIGRNQSNAFVSENRMTESILSRLLYDYKAGIRCSVIVQSGTDECVYTGTINGYSEGLLKMKTANGVISFAPSDVLNVTDAN